MNENVSQGNPSGTPAQIDFMSRPPSQSWEPVYLPDSPQNYLWAWFRPASNPDGAVFRIPEETIQTYPNLSQLTMRSFLQFAGINPMMVLGWFINGVQLDAQGGASPIFDQPVPLPVAGMDPNFLVYVQPPVMNQPAVPVMDPQAGMNPNDSLNQEMFKKIEIDWKDSMAIVRKLSMKRKEMIDMMSKLKSLNRDLNVDENRFSTQEDKGEWRDARRILRDISTKLDMHVKQHDIGVTSFAGKREWFEKMYHQYIQPRLYCDELVQIERDFEIYRKTLQTLMATMNSTHLQAGRDGERRARQVLTKIAAKVSTGRNKRFDGKNSSRGL